MSKQTTSLLWFIGLWLVGVISVSLLAYFIKWTMRLVNLA
ncbi:DUF2474 domain-containing protein [Enterovibrio calviensis]|nr:DUF2474 domain-containing protein [Enterovibrio calviensis]